MTNTSPAAKWPLTLDDPVRAVHYALEWNGDCPYNNPESCPRETEVRDVIDAYRTWLAAHPTADDRTVIDGQPRETGPVAPQTPHSPSSTPEGPGTPKRAAGGRTDVPLGRRTEHEIHEVIRKMARIDPSGFRALVARAGWIAGDKPDTGPDSRADSPDSTPDTETDSATTSADTVRTAMDNTLRDQYAEALHATGGPFDSTTAEDLAVAVLAVRDHEMEQLREAIRDRDERHNRQVQLGIRVEQRAERAEAAIAHVRTECDAMEQAMANGHASLSRLREHIGRIRAALDEAPAEAERDQAYRERAHLLAWLSALHPANAVITPATDVDEPGWQLLYLLVGGWQMSWHIAPSDAGLFAHVEHVDPSDPRAQWDGHTTEAKYQRIQEHAARLSEARAATVRIEISPDASHVVDAIRRIRRDGGLPPNRP